MNFSTIITLVIVGGIVWGGFIFFMVKAVKSEKIKKANEQR